MEPQFSPIPVQIMFKASEKDVKQIDAEIEQFNRTRKPGDPLLDRSKVMRGLILKLLEEGVTPEFLRGCLKK